MTTGSSSGMVSEEAGQKRDRRPLSMTLAFVAVLIIAEVWMLVTLGGIMSRPGQTFDWLGFSVLLLGLGFADLFFAILFWVRVAEA